MSVWVVSWSHVIDIHAGNYAPLQQDLLLHTRMKLKPRGALLMDFCLTSAQIIDGRYTDSLSAAVPRSSWF